jgi:hypothetical protein
VSATVQYSSPYTSQLFPPTPDAIAESIEKATTDYLVRPDWNANMVVVDQVNGLPGKRVLVHRIHIYLIHASSLASLDAAGKWISTLMLRKLDNAALSPRS